MTALRLFAIGFIFVCVSIAWGILGGTIYRRTDAADSRLQSQVVGLWGTSSLRQATPTFSLLNELTKTEIEKHVAPREPVSIIPNSNELQVELNLDMRRKGLLWYRTYEVVFDALYEVSNPDAGERLLTVKLRLPTDQTTYDDFRFTVGDKSGLLQAVDNAPGAICERHLVGGEKVAVRVHYKARGMDDWRYSFGQGVTEARNFTMVVHTNFDRINFPGQTLSPTTEQPRDGGWDLNWQFTRVMSGLDMGVEMPEKLQPGPWAARLSLFAPVGLLFYIFVLVVVGVLTGRNLHPMHYFFIAGGFFAFHILLAYTVDLIDMNRAFAICSVVSVLLVVSYLWRVAGAGFALGVAAPAQLAFLVLFSYAFYYPGYTGLAITIASIISLALMMHLTARLNWEEKLGRPHASRTPGPQPPGGGPGGQPPRSPGSPAGWEGPV